MVRVCSENGTFFKTAAIVYILPLVLALVFYGVSSFLPFGGNEMLRALCAGIGFVAGVLVAVAWDRAHEAGRWPALPCGGDRAGVFGYVRAVTAVLPPEEQARYRAVYCGLCKTLGERYGKAAS